MLGWITRLGNQTAVSTLYFMADADDKIVGNAVSGDPHAFGLLYDRYQPMIYRFIAVKVGRREDAEDLTHQVFLSAWQNIANYRDLGHPFSSWLYRIARNQVIDHYRSRKNSEVSIDAEDFENLLEPVAERLDPSQKFAVQRALEEIRRLKPDYQDVLLMRFVEDMSVRETAKAMRRSEGAIKVLQHRAMHALQETLKNFKEND
jgi:RNA polymerase sigma-70 factor (ECF subfamily)